MSSENNEESKPKQEPSDLDRAAYDIEYVMPKALSIAANMKAGELYRVFSMLIQYPIVKNPKRFRSVKENELFLTSVRLMSSKAKIMEHMRDSMPEIQEEAVDGLKNEIIEQMTEVRNENAKD